MDPLEQLGREVGRAIGEGPGPERRRSQRRAAAQLTTGPIGHDPWRRWVWPLATVGAALLIVWLGRRAPESAGLTARSGDRPFAAGAWLAAEDRPLTLEFGEGSSVIVTPQAAARLVAVEDAKVVLHLERGALELAVTPTPGRSWQVAAGPFAVEVTGTVFTVEWQPQPRTLTVAVREGEVRVRGGSLPAEGSAIAANQRLEVRDVVATPEVAVAEMPVATKDARKPAVEEPRWKQLAAAGKHAEAIAEIERVGAARVLERASAEELDRVAHSARLADVAVTAKAALQALRRRFAGDPRARTAAFLLGRVALEQDRDANAAAEWFAVYVQEQPSGPLAEEARGRLLEIRRAQGEAGQVQAAARAYLEHHPEGSRAATARALLDPP